MSNRYRNYFEKVVSRLKQIKINKTIIPDFKCTSKHLERSCKEEDLLLQNYESNEMLRDIYIGLILSSKYSNGEAYNKAVDSVNDFFILRDA